MSLETWAGLGALLASLIVNAYLAWTKQKEQEKARAKLADYQRLEQHLIDIWRHAEGVGTRCSEIINDKGDHKVLASRIDEGKKAIQILAYSGLKSLGAVHRDANWYARPEVQRDTPREK